MSFDIRSATNWEWLITEKSCFGDLMKMSIVDTIDLLYSIYAIGVFVFIAYFAYKLTTPRSK